MILQSCYDLLEPNKGVFLSKIKTSITIDKKVHEIDCEVFFKVSPDAGIDIRGSFPERLFPFEIEDYSIDIKGVRCFCVRANTTSSGTNFIWCPKQNPIIGIGNSNTKLSSVIFHVFNYKPLIGTRRSKEVDGESAFGIEHVDLKVHGWRVELRSLKESSNTFNLLKEKGGYGLTHIGCLRKTDNSSFNGKIAGEMLHALRFFLSFSKGMWCNPCLAAGFNKKDKKVWESWITPQGQWACPLSWFDEHHCDQLVGFFPGFLDKWENKYWQKALREVIYWYLSSNCSTLSRGIGIDAGIILAQTAIERLSFEYVVRDKRLIEKDGFKNLKASDKFRMLFSSLNIPIDIPETFKDIKKLASQCKWIDAPHAITEVRNSLVHPEHKRQGQFDKVFFSIWNLSQWYLELAILKICNYSGTYSNRFKQGYVGQVDTVPWDNTC